MPWRIATPADSTSMVSCTSMLPSGFTAIRESNERIRSVSVSLWAMAAAARKAKQHTIKRFFIELVTDYISTGVLQKGQSLSGLSYRSGLVLAHAAGDNLRAEVVFAAHGTTGHTAQDGELASVSEGVRHGTLEKLLRGSCK